MGEIKICKTSNKCSIVSSGEVTDVAPLTRTIDSIERKLWLIRKDQREWSYILVSFIDQVLTTSS